MILIDTNILLYAVNEDAVQHEVVNDWWHGAIESDETLGLPWVVTLGFLRLATNPRVFPSPLTLNQALARIDAWHALPNAHVPMEKDNHWRLLRQLLDAAGTAGNLTTDAHLAALAISRDATLVSCDNDFRRFAGLRYFNPLRQRD